MNRYMHTQRHKQGGASLMVSLIMLMLVTLMALAMLRTSLFEERMIGNTRDRSLAFEAAELALRTAEDILLGSVSLNEADFSDSGGINGAYYSKAPAGLYTTKETDYWLMGTFPGADTSAFADKHDWDNNAIEVRGGKGLFDQQNPPRYVLERYSGSPCSGNSRRWVSNQKIQAIYRVTSLGYGRYPETRVILQTWVDPGC